MHTKYYIIYCILYMGVCVYLTWIVYLTNYIYVRVDCIVKKQVNSSEKEYISYIENTLCKSLVD